MGPEPVLGGRRRLARTLNDSEVAAKDRKIKLPFLNKGKEISRLLQETLTDSSDLLRSRAGRIYSLRLNTIPGPG